MLWRKLWAMERKDMCLSRTRIASYGLGLRRYCADIALSVRGYAKDEQSPPLN